MPDPGAAPPDRDELVGRLALAGCVAAEEEADELLAATGGGPRLDALARRREAGEPLAWLVGGLDFCGRRITVAPGVYVPRHQTEQLAREAAARLAAAAPGRAADLCTGCGAVAAHLARAVPAASVVGVDRDRRAVANARSNGVAAVCADAAGGALRADVFDVVTAVAPYVPTAGLAYLPADVRRWEPPAALDGGPDGLDVVRAVVGAGRRLLRPGGWLLAEVGGDQDELLAADLGRGFDVVERLVDDDGDLRGVAARRAEGRGSA